MAISRWAWPHTNLGAAIVIFPFAVFHGALSPGGQQINPRRAVPIEPALRSVFGKEPRLNYVLSSFAPRLEAF